MVKTAIQRSPTVTHKGFGVFDPTAARRRTGTTFFNALLATALFRCWHLLILFGAWATLVTILNEQGHKLIIQPTLLTVTGTVLGFVVSYRTTSSFERYNEGRRLWSQIILATRTFARTVWFHIPDPPATEKESAEMLKARAMIEKTTVINLLEAFSVSVKHYLRGEDGIYYEDLYYLVKFLPAYALPPGIPSTTDLQQTPDFNHAGHGAPLSPVSSPETQHSHDHTSSSFLHRRPNVIDEEKAFSSENGTNPMERQLPLPTALKSPRKGGFLEPPQGSSTTLNRSNTRAAGYAGREVILSRADEAFLLPPKVPPKSHIFDIFPFSLFARLLTKKGKSVKGKKAARLRAKMKNQTISHNLPLEISLYLSSYIAALQQRKINEVPTTNTLLAALNQLVDSLTGLERILTTPIPFSYSIHLWVVTFLYCLVLPPQIWVTLHWLTIPATVILTFIFCGFLVAGEEIENPFGYDKNDLNLDHFTQNIIRNELDAITSTAAPDPARWAFTTENDLVFARDYHKDERRTPQEWLKRGYAEMQSALSL